MGEYQIIYCDPPWHYNNRKTGGERCNKTKFGGGAMKHYPLMKDEELLALAPFVDDLAAENCAMFMWATMPRLDFAIELLQAWGFRYVTTAFTWVKGTADGRRFRYGPGYYTASNTEIVLLGIRGRLKPRTRMVPSVVFTPRGKHSEKPNVVRQRIRLMYPEEKAIELFARQRFMGWDYWGNEVGDSRIEGHSLG